MFLATGYSQEVGYSKKGSSFLGIGGFGLKLVRSLTGTFCLERDGIGWLR